MDYYSIFTQKYKYFFPLNGCIELHNADIISISNKITGYNQKKIKTELITPFSLNV